MSKKESKERWKSTLKERMEAVRLYESGEAVAKGANAGGMGTMGGRRTMGGIGTMRGSIRTGRRGGRQSCQ